MTFLGELEDEIEINFPHAELMVYTISPSHESPSTYPMLSNNDIVQTGIFGITPDKKLLCIF